MRELQAQSFKEDAYAWAVFQHAQSRGFRNSFEANCFASKYSEHTPPSLTPPGPLGGCFALPRAPAAASSAHGTVV